MLHIAEDADAHVVAVKVFHLAVTEFQQQPHQHADFFGGALPVFRRKRVKRKHFYPEVAAFPDDCAHRFHTRAVAHCAGQAALFGPAAVSVHDDGHMPGQAGEVHLRLLLGGCLEKGHFRFVPFLADRNSAERRT